MFLIPITVSSLRGLTHILTCREEAEAPFTVVLPEDGPPTILSSATVERGEDGEVCGGLSLATRVAPVGEGRIRVTLPITNGTDSPWQGSVALKVQGTTVPVSIGAIGAGRTREESVVVRVPRGTTVLDGSLLVGP